MPKRLDRWECILCNNVFVNREEAEKRYAEMDELIKFVEEHKRASNEV